MSRSEWGQDGQLWPEKDPLQEGRSERGQRHVFLVTDVGKPLASATRIVDKGSTVVFSRKPGGSDIMNNHSGRKIQLTEEKGTFVMYVEYLEPDLDSEGYARQGN